uniref:Salivary lipocalin n=1 Tax=Triatoma infestans TaxID=30076 RepID=A6YPH4_TRIIF|nr:salivary lipocalin [Triatoma infestans]
MKTIIAVTILGIVMNAFGEECVLKPGASNFDSKKYFDIPLAYVTHSQNDPETNVCRDYQSSRRADGKPVTSFTITDRSYPTGAKVTCVNNEIKGEKGHFTSVCELPAGNKYEVKSSILATDNESYAVLQRCGTSGPGNILVLQTKKNGVNPAVTKYLNANGWDITKWISRQTVRC